MALRHRSDGVLPRLWAQLRRRAAFGRRVTRRATDLRDLSPYMRWDIGITDIGPIERGWR